MTEALREYLLSVCLAALFCALALSLLPQGSVRRIAGLSCGLLMTAAALGPLIKLNDASVPRRLAALRMEAEEQRTGIEIRNLALVSQIIKEKTESYILDKAKSLEMTLQVEVTMDQAEGQPYPKSVKLTGHASHGQKTALQEYVEENFGISGSEQEWDSG